ncbi:hypothetical protein [Moraxella catarrhalis]|uniref:hypothetical protein n=1 Tax=Moraxella catarrhalis TaxID=480 RepID=UPI00128D337C|nr:hypothetical protein [Moraxella catarrhalis]MPY07333.1 hypothetical protein [Moraxella catarrhalis]
MKKILSVILLTFITMNVSAKTFEFYQTDNIHNKLRLNTITGEIYQLQSDGQKFLINPAISPKGQGGRYDLVKTKNMWTYILVDSFHGKLWQCQYSIKGDNYRFCETINGTALAKTNTRKFTIEPMTSMFQYYLINQQNGKMWQFQWSNKSEDGYIWIKEY